MPQQNEVFFIESTKDESMYVSPPKATYTKPVLRPLGYVSSLTRFDVSVIIG